MNHLFDNYGQNVTLNINIGVTKMLNKKTKRYIEQKGILTQKDADEKTLMIFDFKKMKMFANQKLIKNRLSRIGTFLPGAGDGNRTRVSTLARWCSTIELRLHQRLFI